MRQTKLDKAKVIVTALHNLPHLVTEKDNIIWKEAKKLSRKSTSDQLQYHYELAHKILTDRIKPS